MVTSSFWPQAGIVFSGATRQLEGGLWQNVFQDRTTPAPILQPAHVADAVISGRARLTTLATLI